MPSQITQVANAFAAIQEELQPVRGILQTGGVRGGWALPHHRSTGAEPERVAHPQP